MYYEYETEVSVYFLVSEADYGNIIFIDWV